MIQLKPAEILEVTIRSSETKSKLSLKSTFILAIIAGIFIALAGAGANMASFYYAGNTATAGLAKTISGLIFPAGLIMVVLAGGELFTGNCMMLGGVLDRKITLISMVRNWIIVYIGNLIGSLLIAWMIYYSGLLDTGGDALKNITISIALNKVSLSFGPAFVRGILCNFLVCIAVWIANGADSTIGKIFGMFFPIWLFVTCGFEHSIANMFFIPTGIFADGGTTACLNWYGFFVTNLIPVTLGNIVGGSIFVACAYYYAYKNK